MNQTRKSIVRKARLPLAVVAAGSLALGGVASGTAIYAPAVAATQSASNQVAGEQAAYPIYNYDEFTVVDKGQEFWTFNYDESDPANGVVVLTDNNGLVSSGDEVWLSASSVPNTGGIQEAKYENGQVVLNGPLDSPDGYSTWSKQSRQVSFSVSTGPDAGPDMVHHGGVPYVPEQGISLITSKVGQEYAVPFLPVGSEVWSFDSSSGPSWLSQATVSINYYSDAPDAPNGGFIDVELTDVEISDGQLTISDPILSEFAEGDGYQVTFRGTTDEQNASVYMGLYGKQPEPTTEPTEEPTTEPTTEPTVEPTEEPTSEPTVEPTEEPTAEPTAEPTVEPTEEPTAEPTAEPTVEPTTDPTTEPTEVPEAVAPESGDQVAPGEENLAYDSDTSDPAEGIYAFNVNADVEEGEAVVTYRTSPSSEPQTIKGTVKDGQLVIKDDDSFGGSVKDFNQILITVEDSNGNTISALLSGESVLNLQSKIIDNRLGVLLSEAGSDALRFDIPAGFPTVSSDNFSFDLEYVAADGTPAILSAVDYDIDGETLVINDSRVSSLTAGTYYLTGEQQEENSDGAKAAAAGPAAEEPNVTVSAWFGLYDRAEESPSPSDEPSEDPSSEPSEDSSEEPTAEPTQESTPTASSTEDAPSGTEDRQKDHRDELADTGANGALLTAGGLALALIAVGGIAMAMRRRGNHG
ncbi:PT domain-containing protein [Glutamicibacter sp. Je.9.36]|uniref:PT domain-containing protein n=1 Tax=Glutamicibacter sp. Je.9.36 TaxID=3142837 RepID=UPI003DA959F3